MRPLCTLYVLVGLVLFSISVQTADASENAGYHFLRTHVGARPSALAGAFTAISGDIYSMYYNPAGLATIEKRVASATYLNHVLDFQSGFLGYAHNLKKHGILAFGINYLEHPDRAYIYTCLAADTLQSINAGYLVHVFLSTG